MSEQDEREDAPSEQGLELVGTTIRGRYEIVRELGAGSLGRVFMARDRERGGETIALKVVRKDRVSAEALSYLRGEFVNLARLRHPNVARVYDLDRLPEREEIFFTEEHLDGPDIVQASRGKPPLAFVDLFVQALRALAYVHARGLLHADIKPKNVFVVAPPAGAAGTQVAAGVVKIMDFHLARELAGAFDRSLRGTIAYMAPEVVRGERPDARADLYSLGVVAYEALAGTLPFAGRAPMEMLRAHAMEKVQSLRDRGVKVPPPLEAVVLRLLEKLPDARFRGANDVIRALNAGLGRRDAIETAETRESYILSPRFVGREKELAQLVAAARSLTAGSTGKDGSARDGDDARKKKAVELSFDGMAQEGDASGLEPLGAERVLEPSAVSLVPSDDGEEDAPLPREEGEPPRAEGRKGRPPRVFLVRGEDGVGKTRLLRELRVQCQVEGLPVHELSARAIERPYQPFLDLLAAVLRRERHVELLEYLGGHEGRIEIDRLVEPPGPDESLRGVRFRKTAALGSLLVETSQRQPFAILVEDAEALDEGSVELVRYLAADDGNETLVVLAAADEGEGTALDGLAQLPRGAEVTLERLPLPRTAELLASMLAVEAVPEDFARKVHDATGGNPRFVEESVRSLAEAHAIATREGVLQIGKEAAAKLEAPRGVVEVAARRVERLDPEEKLLLAAFAASPRPRPLAFAVQVAAIGREKGEQAFHELVKRGLLDAREGQFLVEAGPVREAALEALPLGKERELHLACARLLESRHPSSVAFDARGSGSGSDEVRRREAWARDRAEELLHHLSRAGAAARACRYALEAAESARGRFEPARAAKLYQRALELARDSEEPLPAGEVALARARLGEMRLLLGDRRGAAIALAEAADEKDAPAAVIALARRLDATLKKALGAYDRADRALDRASAAAKIAAAEGDREGERELARIRAERASVRLWRGDYAAALEEGQAALAALEKHGLGSELAPVCQVLFHAAHFSGRDEQARAFLRRGLDAPRALDPRSRIEDRSPGPRAALQALESKERAIGDAGGTHVPMSALGAALDRAGRAHDLETIYERKVDLLEATRDLEGAALAHNNLANLRRLAGRFDLAIRGYRRALALHRALGGRPGVAVARLNLARAVAEVGDPHGAEDRALRARSTARSCGARWIEAQAELAIADACRRKHDLDGARQALASAQGIVDAIKNVPLRAEADLGRAEIELDAAIEGSGDLKKVQHALDDFDAAPASVASALSVARGRILRARALVLEAREAAEGKREGLLDRARGAAEEALEGARALASPELVWRAARARAAARAGQGQLAPALEDLVLAMETLRKVAQGLPRDLRALYLQEPSRLEVREAFKALKQ
jgi:serine/threonine-protein kinase